MGLANYKSPSEKFLFLLFIQATLFVFSSCLNEPFQGHPYENSTTHQTSQISGGMRISDKDPISLRALYLAIDSEIYPTFLGYQAQQKDFCTAVAIHPRIVLTAAHCIQGQNPKSFHVIRGVSPWQSKLDPDLWHPSEAVLIHPNFKSGSPKFDVGLILLSKSLPPNYVVGFLAEKVRSLEVILAGFGFRSALPQNENQIQFQTHAGELFAVRHYVQDFSQDDLLLKLHSNAPIVCAGDSGSPMLAAMPANVLETSQSFQDFAVLGILAGGQKENPNIQKSINSNPSNQSSPTQSPFNDRWTMVEQTCLSRALYVNLRHPLVFDWITSSIVRLNQLLDKSTK